MRKVLLSVFTVLTMMAAPVWAADSYKIDPVHSNIGFSAKHMMVSHVSGQFNKYEGSIMYDPNDLINSKIDVSIDVSSIDTRNAKRDDHLRNADFFDVSKFPSITFVSKTITSSGITGDLTMKGVTKEITIPATIEGPVKTPFGATVIGINGSFTLNRQDYGITWNKTLDQGGLAVSDDITVNISIEASKEEIEKK